MVILSFADRATEDIFHGRRTARVFRLPPQVRRSAERKLDMLDAARELGDLGSPPGNRLEALQGDRWGCHAIRVNTQWRIVFRWTPRGPTQVELAKSS
jgi:proteic killer suppression protein